MIWIVFMAMSLEVYKKTTYFMLSIFFCGHEINSVIKTKKKITRSTYLSSIMYEYLVGLVGATHFIYLGTLLTKTRSSTELKYI